MAVNSSYVTTSKPKISGAIYVAPLKTALPTDATTELGSAFKCLGYVSEDGLTNSTGYETSKLTAWGGDVVKSALTGKSDSFKLKLLETMNVDVLKTVYGDSKVTGTLDTGIAISVASAESGNKSYVVEMILTNDAIKRIVIPEASISELGDIVYKDDELTGYELTLSALPDASGNTHYEYIKAAT